MWPHRWEHDKNPEEFFAAVGALAEEGLEFEVAVAGQAFKDVPEPIQRAEDLLGDRLVHLGEPKSREELRPPSRVLGCRRVHGRSTSSSVSR